MPTYEYACKSCGEHVEVVQSFSDDPLAECPSCGGPLRKVFGTPAIVLKGSGFYKTDSRTGANGKSATVASKDSGASEAKGSSESGSSGTDKDGGAKTKDSSSSTSSDTPTATAKS